MFNISIAQISIWIWSNALYNSWGNQINVAQINILQSVFTNQIKCWFLMRGENRSTLGKTSPSRVENQQTQSTYDTGSRNRTRATLVEGKCSHHYANPATRWVVEKLATPKAPPHGVQRTCFLLLASLLAMSIKKVFQIFFMQTTSQQFSAKTK